MKQKDPRLSFSYGFNYFMNYSLGATIVLTLIAYFSPAGDYLNNHAPIKNEYHNLHLGVLGVCLAAGVGAIGAAMHKPKPRRFTDIDFGCILWGAAGVLMFLYYWIWLRPRPGLSSGTTVVMFGTTMLVLGMATVLAFSNRNAWKEYQASQGHRRGSKNRRDPAGIR